MAPFKRMRQPKISTQALLDYDLGESSSDSDFRIEDHCSDASRDGKDDSSDGSSSSSSSDSDSDADSDDIESADSTYQLQQLLAEGEDAEDTGVHMNGLNGNDLDAKIKSMGNKLATQLPIAPMKPMCCVCLGERSDDSNEIIECDACGVSVHEGCYGVSDNVSISSTNSTCSTEPWFCEACRAGVIEPSCELCPNKGGIYKETDVGKWVHLICALYVPGVAFGEVEQLSSVTLFEMQYSKWGAKVCSLCENPLFARTGVCIGCDAGMCKTFFHVTCAQAAGFLIEAHHEDADAADPFYAHCKVHSEKEMIRKRKRNYQTLRINMQQKEKERLAFKLDDPSPAQLRIQRKLMKYQSKYSMQKQLKPEPWVPTQKMSRLLTTSASACKRLLAKANVLSVDVELLERQEAQIAALTDIRKKWHIPPAFSVEFVAYYQDRISRTNELKQELNEMMVTHERLAKQQDTLRAQYDRALDELKKQKASRDSLIGTIMAYHKTISALCPNKVLPNPENIGRPQPEPPKVALLPTPSQPPQRPISVPTAAALKMGVGFPLAHLVPPGSKVDGTRMLSTHAKNSPNSGSNPSPAPNVSASLGVQNCGICKRCNDQHLLANCDTCHLHYHLGCLNPPLTRHPKKSKQYGWQCSECCDKSDASDVVVDVSQSRRKSRTRYSQEGFIVSLEKKDSGRESVLGKRRSTDNAPVPDKRRSTDSATVLPTTKALNKLLPIVNLIDEVKAEAKRSRMQEKSISPKKPPAAIAVTAKNEESTSQLNILPASQIVIQPEAVSNPLIVSESNNMSLPSMVDDSCDPTSKQARKQKRKDKHRSKHNLSSDTEKSPNKEHKRKRKKKQHFDEIQTASAAGDMIPKIKIKFKPLPLPGEDTPEAQFFYVSADAVRSAEEASRPTSVETVEEITTEAQIPIIDNVVKADPIATANLKLDTSPVRKVSPRKASPRVPKLGRPRSVTAVTAPDINCCVCKQPGKSNQVVTCDECHKHYHFTCLDPPLKKTPKIRGYSWHCADCDPTEEEHL